ncbi:hypothetical protein KIY87_gp12 [Mycobacterium phage Malec]|uniref:Gp84-like domain-containing protein n=2 Tax=Turbidovirus TaxID=2948936 RepID=A0A0A0RU46_9CAUD|nr:hypothetical protein PBI_LARENN_89 [Mycobacterium phage Larenn]YP_010064180.1 hypothetical protein KIY87_gp12 [Mycobacterium phage Malec]AIW02984.1 hypothetical protein PBI_LARENN_89 [Mycobacterium phage Larenn]AZV00883.1 hypothetical protein SEA_MALEC_89 [Mycobacterium phage Malec]
MFTLTVRKIGSDKTGVVSASARQVVLDHLEASTKRNGFEVTWNEPGVSGDVLRDGQIVATWEVTAA